MGPKHQYVISLSAMLILLVSSSCVRRSPVKSPTPSLPVSQPVEILTITPTPTIVFMVTTAVTATVPPTETPVASIFTITPRSDCKNAAVLLRDVTIPDNRLVKADEKFIKTWEFKNTGTCPWVNYTLKFSKGDEIHAPLSIPMPAAAPNEKVQVSMEMTAPAADGAYAAYFILYNSDGEVVPIGAEKTFWVKFFVGAYAVIPTALGGNPAQSGNCIHSQNAAYVSQIISLINTERANVGLPALTVDTEMAAFAQSHAEDMAFNNFLSHDSSNGSFGERMYGYTRTHSGYGISSEILAIGTPQYAMDQWRRDEHWNFVLGNYNKIGVGYAYNSCSDFGGYFTVDFGS